MFPRRLEKKENPSRWITTLGYLSAGVVAVTLFVYLTFPWDKLSLWAQAQVENKTGMDLKVGKSEVKFPFHMVWKDVTFSWSGPGSSQVKAERLSVEWPLRAILGRRLEVKFLARLFGGEFRGLLASENGEKGTVYNLRGSGDGFKFGDISPLTSLPFKEVNGTLRIASLEHAWINEKWRLGEGKTVVEISNILVKVSSPQVSEFDLSIDRIKGEIGLKGGMGGLEDISATGTDFDLVGSGTLLLRPRFSESLLDFNSRLTLKTPKGPLAYLSLLASPGGSLDLSIRGPLQRPTPYINGQPLPAPGIAFGNIRSEGEKEGLTGKGIKVAGVISS